MADTVSTDVCMNCGTTIGKLEKACVWNDAVVCVKCHSRLNETENAPQAKPPVQACTRCFGPLGPDSCYFNGKKFCRACYSLVEYTQTQSRPQTTRQKSDQTTFDGPIAKVIFAILAIVAVCGLVLFILEEMGYKLLGL